MEGHGGGLQTPLIQVVIGGWPWLPLWPFGIVLAWRQRRRPWGLWSLGLTVLMSALVLPLWTQLPWYSLLFWPPFALACGPLLADLATGRRSGRLCRGLGRIWAGLGALLLIASGTLLLLPAKPVPAAALIAGAAGGLGLLLGGWRQGWPQPTLRAGRAIAVVATGWILALALLFASPLWNWERNEQPSLTPALELAAEKGSEPLHLLEGDEHSQRPSLHWYLDLSFPPLNEDSARWPRQAFTLLVHSDPLSTEARERCRLQQTGESGWQLWTCQARAAER
ncbi:MAG: hypothetical protein ACKO50_01960 [Cyanobium sp.]